MPDLRGAGLCFLIESGLLLRLRISSLTPDAGDLTWDASHWLRHSSFRLLQVPSAAHGHWGRTPPFALGESGERAAAQEQKGLQFLLFLPVLRLPQGGAGLAGGLFHPYFVFRRREGSRAG